MKNKFPWGKQFTIMVENDSEKLEFLRHRLRQVSKYMILGDLLPTGEGKKEMEIRITFNADSKQRDQIENLLRPQKYKIETLQP